MKRVRVVGIGGGGASGMTLEAREALEACDLIVGYTEYVRLVGLVLPDKPALPTPMMREVERCRMALDRANAGEDVCMVCSGDSGVYGMASPMLELADEYPEVEVEVIAGVTAAQSGSAVLGAALSHDFACVSLSDLLTPWELIERRLRAVAEADFCLALYNPRSKRRADHLARAAQIMIEAGKPAETVCGWVRNIGREGQQSGLTTLEGLKTLDADMFTTVYVGNANTKVVRGKMVTPRGYRQIKDEG